MHLEYMLTTFTDPIFTHRCSSAGLAQTECSHLPLFFLPFTSRKRNQAAQFFQSENTSTFATYHSQPIESAKQVEAIDPEGKFPKFGKHF